MHKGFRAGQAVRFQHLVLQPYRAAGTEQSPSPLAGGVKAQGTHLHAHSAPTRQLPCGTSHARYHLPFIPDGAEACTAARCSFSSLLIHLKNPCTVLIPDSPYMDCKVLIAEGTEWKLETKVLQIFPQSPLVSLTLVSLVSQSNKECYPFQNTYVV